ncbi:replication-relaxation family protein [Nocardia sp. NPDC051052]|uniref:replication-relaxation family protein n=1 Tax=Nocardia sp. NPDC051052 TaxID=3364322 RepID=UPI00379DF581
MNRQHTSEIDVEVHVEIRPAADSRVVHHFASTRTATSSLVNSQSSVVRATTDGAHSGTSHPSGSRRPVSVRQNIWSIGDTLSDRDWAVLRSVAEHRFLSVSQIHALHFADLSSGSGLRIAQRVLVRLRELRLLGTLERRVGGVRAGSAGLVHYVDANGERLLKAESGQPVRRHLTDPSETFLKHTLAIADTHVSLAAAHREQRLELLAMQIEPTAWRQYIGIGGARLRLKPDLYAETAISADSEYEDSWFIEVDRGTESIPTLVRKCRDYEAYRRSGIEQDRSEGTFPQIVWSMSANDPAKAERRRVALRQAIDKDRALPSELFHIIAPDALVDLMQEGSDL